MLTKVGRIEILKLLVTDPGLNLEHRLVKNNVIPSDEDVTLADITEATFDGYAPEVGVAYPVPIINGADHGETLSPTITWTAGPALVAETIFAAYLTVTIGGVDKLLWFKRFSAPISLMNPGDLVEKKFDLLSDDGNVPPF